MNTLAKYQIIFCVKPGSQFQSSKFFFIGFCLLIYFNNGFGQDLNVFDFKLGDTFNVRECKCIVEETATKDGIAVKKNKYRGLLGKKPDIAKRYVYTENLPASGKCFQRIGLYYTEWPTPGTPGASELPAVLPPNNEKVKLIYARDLRPSIADAEDIWLGIQDHKITGIRFYFNYRNADSVYNDLAKKYGKASAVSSYSITSPAGSRRDYYEAKWTFQKLTVTFLGLDTNQIGYVDGDAPLGYRSEVGSITIQYKIADQKKAANTNLKL